LGSAGFTGCGSASGRFEICISVTRGLLEFKGMLKLCLVALLKGLSLLLRLGRGLMRCLGSKKARLNMKALRHHAQALQHVSIF
jgi:hypothetical protein